MHLWYVVASNEHLKQQSIFIVYHVENITHYIALTGTGLTFEMIPYKEEAELNLTRDEFYNVYFRIDMPELLPVEPSIRVLMSYPSGIIDNTNFHYVVNVNVHLGPIDESTGRKNTIRSSIVGLFYPMSCL